MKKYLKLFICISLVLSANLSLNAKDFGLLLDQSAGFGGTGSEGDFDYSGILIPRFSAFLSDNSTLYVSAGLRVDYQDEGIFIPELLRTEFSWRSENREFTAGRMQYSDPLGFIAEGLFDGAYFTDESNNRIFSIGAWYTGFLYKKRAYITMTSEELQSYNSNPDYSDFMDTYFAPSRIVAALGWEGLGELVMLKLALLGQFDLSGKDLHSQYLIGKITVPANNFIFDLGGCLELIENSENGSSSDFGIGLAGELGFAWMLPTVIEDRLSFLGRFSSGVVKGSQMDAFQPLTTKTQGSVLKAKLSGMSMLSLDYIARLHQTFSAGITSSYFVRSDLASFQNYGTKGHLLGNEFYGRCFWSPVSDIQLNLGGGVFLPSMGNAAPKAESTWRVELNVILSLY